MRLKLVAIDPLLHAQVRVGRAVPNCPVLSAPSVLASSRQAQNRRDAVDHPYSAKQHSCRFRFAKVWRQSRPLQTSHRVVVTSRPSKIRSRCQGRLPPAAVGNRWPSRYRPPPRRFWPAFAKRRCRARGRIATPPTCV